MYYRHSSQVSAKYYAAQMEISRRIVKEQLEDFLLSKDSMYSEDVYIDFLVQEINGSRKGITETQAGDVYLELLKYAAEQENVDFLYARKILLFKALRASFQYNFSVICKVKNAFACIFKDPRHMFRNVTEIISLIFIKHFIKS